MKTDICRKCDECAIAIQPLGFHYIKQQAPAFMLKCKLKNDKLGFAMQCRYVKQCPKTKQ